MESIIINWRGPYNILKILYADIELDKGIYLITRKWGESETLLYIGSTKRILIKRITEHQRDWLSEVKGFIKIRHGIVCLSEDQKFSVKRLKDVEALLIHHHGPLINTVNTVSYNGRDLEVINTGRRGPLKPRVST